MNQKIKEQLLAIFEETNIETEINQKLYPEPDWATHQIVRASGLVEDICEHGIGHPNTAWMKIHDPDGSRGYGIHSCDSCCFDENKEKIHKEDTRSNTPSIESGRCDKT